MPSLTDIGSLADSVEINGKKIDVLGISAEGLVVLIGRFPELRRLLTGNTDQETIDALTGKLPEAVGAIIAISTGSPGDAAAEKVARSLPVGSQVEILKKTWAMTFPRGVKDFLAALETITAEAVVESGKDQDTKSPGPSSSVSDTDTLQK